MTRSFEHKPATRERVPLLVGLMGPSGGGKTFSALRLATGIQRVSNGGPIFVIDTEARRALHYADRFDFQHVPFSPPFSPLDYLAAVEHCVKNGAGTVIIDSTSHEHEGPGGVLEMHDKLTDELAAKWKTSRDNANMAAWKEPKMQRRRLINTMLQFPCNFILCFRAKEKVKVASKKQRQAGEDAVTQLGFMPIAGEEFVFEMTVNCLLLPGAGGVPTWLSDELGEKMMIKLPEQFRDIFSKSQPLSEDIGAELAKWAAGGAVNRYQQLVSAIRLAADPGALEALVPQLSEAKDKRTVSPGEFKSLRAAFAARKDELAKPPASEYDDADPETGELPMRESGED